LKLEDAALRINTSAPPVSTVHRQKVSGRRGQDALPQILQFDQDNLLNLKKTSWIGSNA
jgi:hypothetical protein